MVEFGNKYTNKFFPLLGNNKIVKNINFCVKISINQKVAGLEL